MPMMPQPSAIASPITKTGSAEAMVFCLGSSAQRMKTLIASGKYESNFNGEAYSSVMFQNANLSVRLTVRRPKRLQRQENWR